MSKNKAKFVLQKILPEEQPRKTGSNKLEKARLEVMRNYDKLIDLVRKLEPEVEKHNQRLEKELGEQLEKAVKIAHEKKAQFTYAQRRKIEGKYYSGMRSAYNEAFFQLFDKGTLLFKYTWPYLDTVDPENSHPGNYLHLWGLRFGSSLGKVLLEISQNNRVEMEVETWTNTHIIAYLNPIIAEVPLRPYNGRVWLQRSDGHTSNAKPMEYRPIYGIYIAIWTKHFFGRVAGNHETETFLKDKYLGDPDFLIERAERHHWGDGWSERRQPYAYGQYLHQGYHIAVDAFKHAHMELLYRVLGPKGIDPPYVDGLGYWGYLGDVDRDYHSPPI
jgi:hypothetical protein